ncbi:MAG: hypothetical protein M1815_006054 [Lichina confinis]|nr:MAG: hypothetical protein M1815_006054 [Lichina confinis]
MICQRCLNGVAASVGGTRPSSSSKLPRIWRSGASRTEWASGRRRITSSHRMGQRALSTATPTQQTPDPSALAQATATSPSGAQISSTSAGSSQQAATTTAAIRPKKAIRSSAPAGQPLRGLNYMKNQNDPVALPDSEYPAWLWTCLEPKPGKKDDGAKGSSDKAGKLSKADKKRRAAGKAGPETTEPEVPVFEQSIDLPSNAAQNIEGAAEAVEARQTLTHELRRKRRATIKESNFLKGMK